MPIIRAVFFLVVIALIVLLAAYFLTKQSKYLGYIKQVIKFTGVLCLFVLLFYLAGRLIRF